MTVYKRLDELCDINMGQSPASESYNEAGDGLPFFQGNADFGELYPTTRVWCNDPTKIVEPGTILISVRAPIGALNYSDKTCCIGRGLAGISPKKGVESKYIYYCLKSKNRELNLKGTGSTFKAITKSALGETKVKLTSEKEQNQIVDTLDTVSKTIQLRRQQLSELDKLIKSRFVEMFGDLVHGDKINVNKQKIGELADVTKLAGFEFTEYIKYQDSGDIIMLRGLNCKQGKLVLDNVKYIDKETSLKLPRSRLYKDDILMTYAGTIGDVAIVDEDDKYHLAPNVAKITLTNQNVVRPTFQKS